VADLRIGKLALRLSGMNGEQARCLSQKIASGLERMSEEDGLPERKECLRIRVQATQGSTVSQLAEQAIAELIRELRRS